MKRLNNKSLRRIIESGEFLFSTKGYHATSVRDVVANAKVNLAAINYHFRNKESLYCEILRRRLRPMNQSRLAKLESAIELAGDKPVPLALIFDIFARPFFELSDDGSVENRYASRLIGRSVVESVPFADELLAAEIHVTTAHFARAIRKHVPGLQPTEFMWRLNFVVGAMHHTLATIHQMTALTRGLCQNNDLKGGLSHFTQFAVNTFIGRIP